ncbi:Protein CBG15047 [Caenorhabditis briggsae]|uniref:One cut domain family member n=1 Tax=Caenorhabditis briggsae TaxID=6238 RepID=A8XLA0_CAEBR|nr:Protein CBG15047 [Caenorhabditis briggsae]CAP33425.1 Protein CBG15047 [Caenorhabditis briggsae]
MSNFGDFFDNYLQSASLCCAQTGLTPPYSGGLTDEDFFAPIGSTVQSPGSSNGSTSGSLGSMDSSNCSDSFSSSIGSTGYLDQTQASFAGPVRRQMENKIPGLHENFVQSNDFLEYEDLLQNVTLRPLVPAAKSYQPMEQLVNLRAPIAPSLPGQTYLPMDLLVGQSDRLSPSSTIPSPTSSVSSNTSLINLDANLPNGVSINTADIINACESSRRRFGFNGKMLSQKTFSELVLQRTQAYYSSICKNPKPWESLTEMGKALYVRIYNWIQLSDDEKKTYLEVMEKMEKQPVEPEEKKTRTKFTEYQEKALEAVFQLCQCPTTVTKRSLAKKLNLPFVVIQNYFLNHRRRK